MDYKVVWTDVALDHLRGVVTHIARDNPTAAERVGGDIVARVDALVEPIYWQQPVDAARRAAYNGHKFKPVLLTMTPFPFQFGNCPCTEACMCTGRCSA